MSSRLVSALGVRNQLNAFADLGLDAAALQRAIGVSDDELARPDNLIQSDRLYGLWERAEAAWQRPGLGLHVGIRVPFGAYEVLDYLLLSSASVGEGLRTFAACFALATRTSRYDVHEERDECGVEMVWQIPTQGVVYHLRDFSLAAITCRLRYAAGVDPGRIELAGPPLASHEEYEDVLRCRVVLRATRNAAWFPRDTWNRPLPRRDDALRRTLRRHADLVLASHPPRHDSLIDQVRTELLRLTPVGLPSVEEVSRRLALSPRRLQRRLREEGTTFADLTKRTREELGRRYLQDAGLTVTEVAYLLGFSETSAFSRAFRAWTGLAPVEFRHHHRG